MATTKFVPSRAGKYADEIGAINEELKVLEARRDKLMERLKARTPGLVLGEEYHAKVFETSHTSLNHKRVKRLLGPIEYGKCWKTTKAVGVRITRNQS